MSGRGVPEVAERRLKPGTEGFASETTAPAWRQALLRFVAPAIVTATLIAPSVFAQGDRDCVDEQCVRLVTAALDTGTFDQRFGANTEMPDTDGDPGEAGFTITVDGETMFEAATPERSDGGAARKSVRVDEGDVLARRISPEKTASVAQEPRERNADVGLDRVDIQVKFDGLDVKPVLNVATADLRRAYRDGEAVAFVATSNYPAWIARSEVLIYERGGVGRSNPLAIVPVDASGTAHWTMPEKAGRNGDDTSEYDYILRVYDDRGRFDETRPLTLARTRREFDRHAQDRDAVSPGNGEDRTARRNIPVHGGAVTVYGRNIPPGYAVRAIGETVPVDNDNAFVIQRILPSGDHDIEIAVEGFKDNGISFVRPINIPANDWFYVGIADLTIGKRFASSAVEAADPERYDGVYTKGRLAFYLKGKVKGRYLLTAAADTGEDDIENLFRNLDAKDPRQLLRRIDPDEYYPVYGDDSTAVEDAPTAGKFYVRLERGDSHVMWGNFKSEIKGSGLLRNERALYGASAVYKSQATTSFGERRVEASAYAAQPDTLPQRDIFRGTGGSAYFLSRQDVTRGSETLTVLVTDPLTGRILSRRTLVAGEDFTIDYVQGIVILAQPLASFAGDGGVIRDSGLGGNDVTLVVNYEFTPVTGTIDGFSYGGRIQAWINDKIRVGLTGMNEELGGAEQEMTGVDIRLRHSETTWLEAEVAMTDGPGFQRTLSADGGITTQDITLGTLLAGRADKTGRAYKVKAQLDLADINPELKGRVGGYYEKKEAGFSNLDYTIDVNQRIWGVFAEYDVSSALTLKATHDDYEDAAGKVKRDSGVELAYQMSEYWKAEFGVKYTELLDPTAAPTTEQGHRLDAGVKITWTPNDDLRLYVFGQATLDRAGTIRRNDRLGVGGEVRLSEKVSVSGEVSEGTSGFGALAAVNYDPTPDDRYYVGYKLDPDRAYNSSTPLDGTDLGGIVFGAKRRYNDVLTGFAENNYDMFGRRKSLTSTYGVTYTPDAMWTWTGGLEIGRVRDPSAVDFDRHAVSLGFSYKDGDRFAARLKGELRFDDSEDGSRDTEAYLFSGGLKIKVSDDWRFIANADAVFSDSVQSMTTLLNGDYVEASVGFAYRPVDNDRLNVLFKYTYLYDLFGRDPATTSDSIDLPMQRSHIFSVDASYDVNRRLTLGAKYGFRIGEVSLPMAAGYGPFMRSSAHLAILRADWHVIRNWDLLLEGRILYQPETDTTDYGALAAVYRHFGNNLKAGVGYNFGRFSDDIADLTHDDQGVFFNVIGKF